jgi:hypothetical protein
LTRRADPFPVRRSVLRRVGDGPLGADERVHLLVHAEDDATGVSEVALRFETLRSEALPKAASRDFIAKVAKERWTA